MPTIRTVTSSGVVAVVLLGSGVLAPAALGQGESVVTPGDSTGLQAPSIDLEVSSPASPGQASTPETPGQQNEAWSAPVVPSGLSWSGLHGGAPQWRPRLEVPDFFPDPAPAVTPRVLAQQAVDELVLPLPTPQHSPDLRLADGRSATVVGEHTWFWTDPDRWRPVSRRVQAGAVWAEVHAEPVRLSLDPGNGQDAVSCTGPGTPYDRSFGVHTASPDCGLVFERSSVDSPGEQVTASWSITWRVRWSGFDGTNPVGGELPEMTSQADARLAVAEAQALGTR